MKFDVDSIESLHAMNVAFRAGDNDRHRICGWSARNRISESRVCRYAYTDIC